MAGHLDKVSSHSAELLPSHLETQRPNTNEQHLNATTKPRGTKQGKGRVLQGALGRNFCKRDCTRERAAAASADAPGTVLLICPF